MHGPLAGVTIVELAGLGALPYGSLKLADMGVDVIRVERLADVAAAKGVVRPLFADRPRVDRCRPQARRRDRDGAPSRRRADVFLESFRPGVVERLGVGPDDVLWPQPPGAG